MFFAGKDIFILLNEGGVFRDPVPVVPEMGLGDRLEAFGNVAVGGESGVYVRS